jgi:hypothetical protein
LGEDFRFKPTRWLDDAAGPVPAASGHSDRSLVQPCNDDLCGILAEAF